MYKKRAGLRYYIYIYKEILVNFSSYYDSTFSNENDVEIAFNAKDLLSILNY